ncbi:hypothetical protein FN976_08240 [Caenimonas sedimenti]|uniref:Uncharacterized protein n=1 Tax=Caenimonas sedimenti TaxID=2596921 RepID=A0A562ZU04_9BURK|nr:hypothetical protein [Caenimonas sedimenti]TWO71963.1 hypothetical protein FN976_08240 [Caenimonas sedimenti]
MQTAAAELAQTSPGSFRYCLAVALGCCVAPLAALAQDSVAPLDMVAEATRSEQPVRLELNTLTLPRFENVEAGQSPRVDLSLLPAGGTAVGPMVGMNGFSTSTGLQPSATGANRRSLDLGLHFRHTTESSRQFDLTAWKRVDAEQPDAYTLIQQRQPVYGARVEMKLSPARKTPLLADRGFIGMQLQSGARISIKRKDGKPMVYYRTSF